MPPQLALLVGTALAVYAFRTDKKRGLVASKDLFWACLWYVVAASRPVGVWFSIWGIPLPGSYGDATDGSLIDRVFYGALIVIGLKILAKRQFRWGELFQRNPWWTAFLVFLAVSIVWSQYLFVSFKRYVKVVGALVMACVVLSESQPLQAFCTVIRRRLYIHLPMSLVCTRYYRDIGVSFDWSGSAEAWQGISTSKNTLGQIAALGVVYFSWEVWKSRKKFGWKNIHLLYLGIALYLLKGAGSISMTSVSVSVFAVMVFFRVQSLRQRPNAARNFVKLVLGATTVLVLFVVTHSVVMFSEDSIFGKIITGLGRDITMTGRTDIWHDVYAATTNPLLGVGFGGFWIGRLANIPWNAQMSWVLGQGHSGYVDTYLQVGLIGCFLLVMSLLTGLWKTMQTFEQDFDFAAFRVTIALTVIYIDMTESVYLRGEHHLWLLLLIAMWDIDRPAAPKAPVPVNVTESAGERSALQPVRTAPRYYS